MRHVDLWLICTNKDSIENNRTYKIDYLCSFSFLFKQKNIHTHTHCLDKTERYLFRILSFIARIVVRFFFSQYVIQIDKKNKIFS